MVKEQHGWYKPEDKMNYVEEYFNSGLSITKFSEEKNLCKSTLSTWIRHYKSANLIASSTFQDITPVLKGEPETVNTDVKIILPNGIRMEFDISVLKSVMKELK
jgi:transposase-like protein